MNKAADTVQVSTAEAKKLLRDILRASWSIADSLGYIRADQMDVLPRKLISEGFSKCITERAITDSGKLIDSLDKLVEMLKVEPFKETETS